MMTRDEFKAHAAGTYVLQNKGQAFKVELMDAYTDGAIAAFDKLNKKAPVLVEKDAQRTVPVRTIIENELDCMPQGGRL